MSYLFIIALAINFANTGSSCVFERCRCINNSDETIDIRCIPDLDRFNSGFPNRLANQSKPINVFLINKYSIGKIPDQAFRHLDIKYLIIGQNNLKILTKGAFEGAESISMLHLIENNLEEVEPGSLKALHESLTEFGLTNTNISLLNKINIELRQLKNLRTLKLNNLRLDKFEPNWTESLESLSYLSLASNRLSLLDSNVFSSKLISIDLSQNFVSNVTNLLSAIESGENLKELKLKKNQIKNLTSLSKLSNLEYLDLSSNEISILSKNMFRNLTKLTHLYLTSNRIKNLDQNLFLEMKDLMVLLLNNNFLVNHPNISTLMRLKILDLSSQHGNLVKIGEYAFERKYDFGNLLTLYLNLNEIKFEPKSFCSRQSTESRIGTLDLSLSTLNGMDMCIFRQFKSSRSAKMIIKIDQEKSKIEEASKCNCQIWKAANFFEIGIYGLPNCNQTVCDGVYFEEKYMVT
ncbi:slit -like protein [Brachionus plicatilis]|uniref:Slit-like protein n=1 Tax=Brachionus plicatilis TaxID=10195 RepID=A0A3M7R3I3_BRAPC|nr:slit -like protein [Brachionus plicatilis]